MAKALIKENLGTGQYNIEIIKNTEKTQSKLSGIDAEIAALEATENKTAAIKLQILSLQKKRVQLEAIKNTTRLAWCADYQLDLEGTVGVVNVPDEPDRFVNIKPGTESAYDEKIDGDVHPAMNMLPETAFYNRGILPGVQRWKPRYRYGTIVSTDPATDRCSILVTPAYSSQQGLPINPESTVTMTDLGGPDTTLPGWEHFIENYPDSEIVTNTDPGSDVKFTDNKLSQLESVNNSVNSSHRYVSDAPGHDEWDLMGPGDTGDCDDFTMTKMQELIDKGWPASDLHPTVCYIDRDGESEGHSVLTVDTDKGTYVLDSRHNDVSLTEDSQFANYTWDQRLNGGSWSKIGFGTQLENVPVEYMQCGSSAFAPGDDVLISFSGSWDTPKVIGFRSGPKQCPSIAIVYHDDDGYYVGVVDSDFELVMSIPLISGQTGCAIAAMPITVDGMTTDRELLWFADALDAGDINSNNTYSLGETLIYGCDPRTGAIVTTVPVAPEATYSFNPEDAYNRIPEDAYNRIPEKIACSRLCFYGTNGEGRWFNHVWVTGQDFTGEHWYAGYYYGTATHGGQVHGLEYYNGNVFASINTYDFVGLARFGPTLTGMVQKPLETKDLTYDLCVHNGELYACCRDTVDIYDLSLNKIRAFGVSKLPTGEYPMLMTISGGFLYLTGSKYVEKDVLVYTTEGAFVKNIEFKHGHVNKIK